MTKEQLAEMLNGSQYPFRLSREIKDAAKLADLVVVYGASDDLMEFEGAIYDEHDCYDGGQCLIDREGIIPSWENVQDNEAEAEAYFNRKRHARLIKAIWDEGGYSWQYETAIPHACFDILEDWDTYCKGIVFSLEDL